MDSIDIEQKHDVAVETTPENAHLIFDSKTNTFHRLLGWAETAGAYHAQITDTNNTITLRKYLHPTNRYYFIFSPVLESHR